MPPTVQQSVLPVPDPARPFGYPNCTACHGTCSGHFLSPQQTFNTQAGPMAQPPSVILKDFFNSLHGSEPTDAMVKAVAEKALLPTDEVRLWLEHLRVVNLNRKRGASKAASTRRNRRQPQPNIAGQECATQSQFQTSLIPVSQLESSPQTEQSQSQTDTHLNRVGQECAGRSQFQTSLLESTPQSQSQTDTHLNRVGQECAGRSQFQTLLLESTPQSQSQTDTHLNRVGQECAGRSQFQTSLLESTPQTEQRQSQTDTHLSEAVPGALPDELCGMCGGVYEEETEEEELWISCDICFRWFHGVCVDIGFSSVPETFVCYQCK